MAEAAQGTQHEFWRPPSPVLREEVVERESIPTMAEACAKCRTEFLLGSRFCHTCGARRPEAITASAHSDAAAATGWEQSVGYLRSALGGISLDFKLPAWRKIQTPSWLRYLHFHEIKSRVGLSTGSLISFVIGLACVTGALLVGLLTAKTLVEWQAIQIYRIEWLLGATAAFVLGILLKKNERSERD